MQTLLDNTGKQAENIAKELMKLGVNGNRIRFAGLGGIKPITDNSTKEGKEKNKRIELILQ
jgi:outer membrane protein OmpA-like peptidoglycan-associated protein